MNKRLEGKDFINIGVFTALYFVSVFAVGMLGYIPIFIPLLMVLCPILGGIPMMLYFSKINKFGMLTITGLLSGILMLIGGMGWMSIITGLIFGFLGDKILQAGNYSSVKHSILGHGVYSIWLIGNFIPIVVTRQSYYDMLVQGYGREYADTLMSYISAESLPLLVIAGFVSGLIGAWLGMKIFRKHFERAGIV